MAELDLWAIIWPILKQIFEIMGVKEKLIALGVIILALGASQIVLNWLKPKYHQGNLVSEFLTLIWGAVTFVTPVILVVYWLSTEYQLLQELISYLSGVFAWKETLIFWSEIYVFSVLFVAVQRFLIHKVSLLLQRIMFEIPLIGNLLMVFVLVFENLMFAGTTLMIPLNMIILAREVEPIPIASGVAMIDPPASSNVTPEVWEAIKLGVGRAQANGVSCDPYLMLAIKEYETGSNLCDSTMIGSSSCVSSANCQGMMQFSLETCQRNASRRGVECDVWDPARSVEVACYAIADEMNFNLEQSEGEFTEEFSSVGFIWNADPEGASAIYNRALSLRDAAVVSLPKQALVLPLPQDYVQGYIWPAPASTYVWYEWGVPMWYTASHNGMDIAIAGLKAFQVVALDSGQAQFWNGGACNAGVITLRTRSGDQFYYVHMELDPSKIDIPTTGEWVDVEKGQSLGWILNGTTSCSADPHLHLMRVDGSKISEAEFQR